VKNPSAEVPSLIRRIFVSIFPDSLASRTEVQRKRFLLKNLPLHFRPISIPEKTLYFRLSWGLGGMAAMLVILQMGTGILLKFAYEPTPVSAYTSVQTLISEVPFGRLVHNLHHWGANLLVLIAFLHMLRTYFTGAFHPPRQFNWIIGLTLFCIVLLANLTGYLLPWDQLAYWALTVSTGMLNYVPFIGPPLQQIILTDGELGAHTLRIFFAIHTAVLPVFLGMLMAFHFWRVRKAGGLVVLKKPGQTPEANPKQLPTIPNLMVREAAVASVLVATVFVMAAFFDAPLDQAANPGLSPNPTKAPWYFAGIQELLLHLHPTFAAAVIPLLILIAMISIPYLKYNNNTSGIWFVSVSGRRAGVISFAVALIATLLLIIADDFLIQPANGFVLWSPVVKNGLVPIGLLSAAIFGFYRTMKQYFTSDKNEAIQTVFILLATALVVMTVIGVWFRGPGMKLIWPF
jgi:quinol-cytochrome oxidoreductase complex cytochrome b subunit